MVVLKGTPGKKLKIEGRIMSCVTKTYAVGDGYVAFAFLEEV